MALAGSERLQRAHQPAVPMTMRITFIGFGEVASAFSAALAARGARVAAYDVLLDESGGVERLKARAAGTNVAFCALPQALRDADYVLSTVTTSVAADARAIVRRADGNVAVSDVRPVAAVVAASVARPRATAILLLVFAGLALVLGVVGVHSVVAYAVSQRTHEFGVRLAVGARAGDLVRLVLGDAAMLVAIGLALGLAGAVVGAQALGSLLFEVRPADPLTFASVAVVLGAAGLVAAWLPARRAMRVDPVTALRAE